MDRNTVIDYVARMRTKPEHVRRRIALGTAVGSTAVVGALWLFFFMASGSLAVQPAQAPPGTIEQEDAYANNQVQQVTTQTKNGFQDLMSAVGFASATDTTPALSAVDISTSSAPVDQSSNQSPTGGNQTVIPF